MLEPFSPGEGAGRRMRLVRIQVAYRMGDKFLASTPVLRQKIGTSLLKKQYLHKQLLANV
ncbi:hypothetical protein ASG14_10945 [Pedobacter sp. Leaf194]|nr:hypothetical protein ASG14_10945 [Pedobacter sp. Leaf194]